VRKIALPILALLLVSCSSPSATPENTSSPSLSEMTTTSPVASTTTTTTEVVTTTTEAAPAADVKPTPTTLKPVVTTKVPNKYAELTKEEIFQHVVVSIEKIWPRQFECGRCMNMGAKVREIGRSYPETEAEYEPDFYFIKVMGEERCFQGHQEYISGDWPTMTLNPAAC
jgi:hypothetical protein